jgi:hypothetical protein
MRILCWIDRRDRTKRRINSFIRRMFFSFLLLCSLTQFSELDMAWNEWYRHAITVQAKIMAATTATSRSDRDKDEPAIDDMVEGGRETQTYGQGSSGDTLVKSNIDPGPSGYTSRLRQVRFNKPLGKSQDAQSSRR